MPSVKEGISPCNAGTTCLSNDTFELSYAPLEIALVICFLNPKRQIGLRYQVRMTGTTTGIRLPLTWIVNLVHTEPSLDKSK